MAMQNLVSASIAPETKTDVMQKLADIKGKLNFLLTLQSDEVHGLFKAGNNYQPFIDKAHNVILSHPDLMPAVFDSEEFKKDYQLSKDLVSITDAINELSNSLQNTLLAVSSDALAESLEVYAAVKQHRDKVPGLNVIADEMGKFFKRTRKKAGNTEQK